MAGWNDGVVGGGAADVGGGFGFAGVGVVGAAVDVAVALFFGVLADWVDWCCCWWCCCCR